MRTINAQLPEKLSFLLTKQARYKVGVGGRGGGKSWSFARALLIKGMERPLRILCARELMSSIADSVLKLLSDQVQVLGLSEFYTVLKSSIIGKNGTEFIFAGLRHNASAIKSFESVDLCWIEEGQRVSKESFDILIPTIRKEGSEIWISMNPDFESDDAYRRFILNPPPDSIVVKINYDNNPWFGDTLRREMEYLRDTDPDAYEHVWLGGVVQYLEGAIYAKELREMERTSRIMRVPYDPTRPVDLGWDLGYGDATAIWLLQAMPFEIRAIGYFENSGQSLQYYLRELQTYPYVWGTDFLPWDGGAKSLGTGKSIEEMLRAAGRKVRVVPQLAVADGIAAVRAMFPRCFFDADNCSEGLNRLRRYRYGENKQTGTASREPLHDENSHCADAFRTFAVGVKMPKAPVIQPPKRPARPISAWA